MNILLVGFDGLKSPTKTIIYKLKNEFNNIECLLLKNNLITISDQLKNAINNIYDFILIIGQKKGSKGVTIERIALNTDPKNKLLVENDSVAYFNTLPLEKIYKKFKDSKLSIRYSNNAGTRYCNCAFYNTMSLLNKKRLNIHAGLIHIPSINKNNTIEELCGYVKMIIEELD